MSAFCDKILAMDKRIGFAMVANLDGEIRVKDAWDTANVERSRGWFRGIMGGDYPGNRSSDGEIFRKVRDRLTWL